MSTKRNLLLCLDAFGTIFTPRESIAAQYGGVARSFGVKISDEQVGKSFKNGMYHVVDLGRLILHEFAIVMKHAELSTAFKEESKKHPNFGKAAGLGSVKWWTNVGVH